MENRVVVVSLLTQFHKIVDCLRCIVCVQLDVDVPEIRLYTRVAFDLYSLHH